MAMNLLEASLAAAVKDTPMVTPQGVPLRGLTHGVQIRRLVTHADARGSVTELLDARWNFLPHPISFAYSFTIRPGVVKGWNLHARHQDRYCLIEGAMETILWDPRPDSPTCGELCRIVLTEEDRCLVNIPENVWHADRNIGTTDLRVVNFPTIPYDHADPDKYRLPLDTPLIPACFPPGTQGG